MKHLVVVLAFLVLAAPAVAAGPESPPGAHKARVVKRAYTYRQVWYATDGTPIYVTCRVARRTLCYVRRIG